MSLLPRASVALLLSSVFVLAIACGSSAKKEAPPSVEGDGGEAGAAAPHAGSTGGGAAGQGGAPDRTPELGPAGAGGVAGAAEPDSNGEAGSAGAAPACTPSGNVAELSFDSEPTYHLCRGGLALLPYSAASSDDEFSCCAISSAGYGAPLAGLANGDGGGNLALLVPADAPQTEQFLAIACASSGLGDNVGVEVTDTAPPVVTSVTAKALTTTTLVIEGSNLADVDQVLVSPIHVLGGALARTCTIDENAHTALKIECDFGFLIDAGEYRVNAFVGECGSIADTTFTVIPIL